jgi:hypothetical protein
MCQCQDAKDARAFTFLVDPTGETRAENSPMEPFDHFQIRTHASISRRSSYTCTLSRQARQQAIKKPLYRLGLRRRLLSNTWEATGISARLRIRIRGTSMNRYILGLWIPRMYTPEYHSLNIVIGKPKPNFFVDAHEFT